MSNSRSNSKAEAKSNLCCLFHFQRYDSAAGSILISFFHSDQKGQTNEMLHNIVYYFCTIRIIHCHILNNNNKQQQEQCMPFVLNTLCEKNQLIL